MNRWEVHRRADDLLDLRRPRDAELLVRDHLAADPDDADSLLLLAQALHDQKRAREAEEAARAAIILAPASQQAQIVLTDILVGRDDAAGALQSAHEAVRLAPELWTGHYSVARALLIGRLPRVRGALDAALRAVELAPHAAAAHNLVGICFNALNQPDQARQAFTEALRLDPQDTNAAANLAALDADSGRLRRAAQRVTSALGQAPQESALHDSLDHVLLGFARRLLWVVLGAALVIGIEIGTMAPYGVRAATGLGLTVLVGLLVHRFARELPRGVTRWGLGIFRRSRGWARWALFVLGVASVTLVLMAFAPLPVAIVAGGALLLVLRISAFAAIGAAVVGALVSLFRGR